MSRLPPRVRAAFARAARSVPPVGVCVDRSIAIAVPEDGSWQVETFERPEDDAGLRRTLADASNRLGIVGRAAILTLPVGSYSLLQIERPPVPAEEMVEACRWKVKDLVEFSVEDALIDVFDATPTRGRGDQPSVNVIVTPAMPVRSLFQALRAAGLRPAGVEIAEHALRNLATGQGPEDQPVAVMSLSARHGTIQICQGPTLLFARRLDYGLRALGTFDPEATGPHSRLPLDLQRTLDYFDRNYDAGPVTRLIVAPNQPQLLTFMNTVGSESGLAVAPIDTGAAGSALRGLPTLDSAEAALAVGGAAGSARGSFGILSGPRTEAESGPTPRQAMVALAATAALCVAVGVWMQKQLEAATAAARFVDVEIEQIADDLSDRGTHLSERNADPALIGEMRRLEREALEKRRVLDALTGSTLGTTHGFSALLEGLGRGMPRDLWLTRITFDRGGSELRLEGETLDAAQVPELLESLTGEQAFAGTSLAQLSIARDSARAGWLRFVLATPCAQDTAESLSGSRACAADNDGEPAS